LLPNGYDPDDFTGEARHPSPGKLALVHAGSLYARRSPRTFLEGLERFCRINPEAAGKLRVFFWGTLDREVDELLAGWKAGGMVEAGTILPRPACLAGIRGADLLLLVVDDVPVADRIMTGKIFEYLAAGKPILAISDPHSPAAELVVRTRSGIVVPHGRPDQVAACLELVVAAWEEKRLALDQDRGLVAQYSRVEQSRQLARLLDGLVGESGAAH